MSQVHEWMCVRERERKDIIVVCERVDVTVHGACMYVG